MRKSDVLLAVNKFEKAFLRLKEAAGRAVDDLDQFKSRIAGGPGDARSVHDAVLLVEGSKVQWSKKFQGSCGRVRA